MQFTVSFKGDDYTLTLRVSARNTAEAVFEALQLVTIPTLRTSKLDVRVRAVDYHSREND